MSNNGYPFISRRQILERIASEPGFAFECVAMIDECKGWMASHRARAAKLLARVSAGSPAAEDCAEAAHLAARYGKTLARVIRNSELKVRPELAAQAAVFGLLGTSSSACVAPSVAIEIAGEAHGNELAPLKKRGRPKGSKNKIKATVVPRRKRC